MGFELVIKGSHNQGLNGLQISVAKTTYSLSIEAGKFLNKKFVEVYLNREENLVGLKPSSDGIRGFKVTFNTSDKSNERKRFTGTALKMIPLGIYDMEIQDDMLVFKVPEIASR